MTDPLVSILIPTYNGERFLKSALRSALEQSHKNIEVLVGDDASTDRTPEIIAAVAATDPRVRVIRHETNVGAFDNPRLLLAEARGEYVKYLLHDDVLATDCVRVLVRGMIATPMATLAFSRRVRIDENGRQVQVGELPALLDKPGPVDGFELGTACLEGAANLIGEMTTVLFRRDDVVPDELWQVDGRRLDVLGDLGLWLRLLTRGQAFYSPQPLSRFRVHDAQRSYEPGLVARGLRDWPRLLDWGVRHGFLTDEQQQRRAFARVLQMAAGRVAQLVGGPHYGPALEAVHLATTRLAELGTGGPATPGQPLVQRAHAPEGLARFARELDVPFVSYPVAAAGVGDGDDLADTVEAFRAVRAAGLADRFVLAVPPSLLDHAAPLLAAARTTGIDLDIELVPTTSPGTVLRDRWLAVAPRGATWHGGRAEAVWEFDPTRTAQEVGSSVAP